MVSRGMSYYIDPKILSIYETAAIVDYALQKKSTDKILPFRDNKTTTDIVFHGLKCLKFIKNSVAEMHLWKKILKKRLDCPMSHKKGFTLIEILIALVIFTIIIGLSAYSFRFYAGVVNKIIMPYPKNAVIFTKLRNALDSSFYFVGQKKDLSGKENFFMYFYGTNSRITFITTKPLLENTLAVCSLYLKNSQLIWEESPVYSKLDNYKMPQITRQNIKRTVLFKNVSKFNITYFINSSSFSSIKERYPTLIEMNFTLNKAKKKLFFKIKSNFENKIEWTKYLYAPI